MIQLTSKWVGLDTVAKEEFEALRRPTEIAISKATLFYERQVKKKLTGNDRTGRIYIIGGREHQASAPGEAPATLIGKLRQSITHTDVRWEGDEASAEVGSWMPYARILEFGGYTGHARILPRPYFSAAWLEEEAHIQEILELAVKKAGVPVLVNIVAEVAE